jgi:uncharacterized protein YecE (DUF72 family)
MRVRVGTSGFSYKEWKGSFYPEDLPDAKMLRFYGERFDTVEINNTFYRMPKASVFDGWAAEVSKDFAFVLKAPQWIAHLKVRADLVDPARNVFVTAKTLGPRLGPFLVQLPAYLKKDTALLRAFFGLVPRDARIVLEPSHPSWLDDETYAVLRDHGAALCAVDDPKKTIPLVATAELGYVRLRQTAYDKAALKSWADRIVAQPWKEAWVFFKHEDEGTGPRLARAFKEVLAARAGAVVQGPG